MRLRSIPIATAAAVAVLGLGTAGIASAQEDDGPSDVTTVTTEDPSATDDGPSTDDGAASGRAGCDDGDGDGGRRGPRGGAPGEGPTGTTIDEPASSGETISP